MRIQYYYTVLLILFSLSILSYTTSSIVHVDVEVDIPSETETAPPHDEIPPPSSPPPAHESYYNVPVNHSIILPQDELDRLSLSAATAKDTGITTSITNGVTVRYKSKSAIEIIDTQRPTTCLLIGDCLIMGLWYYVNSTNQAFTHQCSVTAKIGISSAAINGRLTEAVGQREFDWVVVSSGSNDAQSPRLEADLEALRKALPNTKHFIWLLPTEKRATELVRKVAVSYGDDIVTFKTAKDHVHPASYNPVVKSIRDFVNNF